MYASTHRAAGGGMLQAGVGPRRASAPCTQRRNRSASRRRQKQRFALATSVDVETQDTQAKKGKKSWDKQKLGGPDADDAADGVPERHNGNGAAEEEQAAEPAAGGDQPMAEAKAEASASTASAEPSAAASVPRASSPRSKSAVGGVDPKDKKMQARLAVAAKISAARALARKLANENLMAAAAKSGGAGASEGGRKNDQEAVSVAARELARSDSILRATRRSEQAEVPLTLEVQKLKAENIELQTLLLELAQDRAAAAKRLESLKEKFGRLSSGGGNGNSQQQAAAAAQAEPAAPPLRAEAAVAPAAEPAAAAAAAPAAEPAAEPAAAPELAPEPEAAPAPPAEQQEEVEEEEAVPAAEAAPVAEPVPSSAWSPPPQQPPMPPPTVAPGVEAAPELQFGPPSFDDLDLPLAVEDASEAAAEAAAIAEALSDEQLQAAARAAEASRTPFFTWPTAAYVGWPASVYYNRKAGPLPAGGMPRIKVGYNKWESMVEVDMRRERVLSGERGEWWVVELALPEELFLAQFVILDARGPAVDNNSGKDFTLPLGDAPTEAEIVLRLTRKYEEWEDGVLQALDEQEDALMAQAEVQADEEAEAARERVREQRQRAIEAEAAEVVAERRRPAPGPAASAKPGVYCWVGGEPEAGETAQLLYNRFSSELRHCSSVRVHVGYDGWFMKDVKQYNMKRLERSELPAGVDTNGSGDWWSARVSVPSTAAMLNYVFSDEAQRVWDNGGGKDFHTPVASADGEDTLEELLVAALDKQSEEEGLQAQQRAAQNARTKVLFKAQAMRNKRARDRTFLFTMPLIPQAGQQCTIYYNPDQTVLRGRPGVSVRGGWNRWLARQGFGPQQMVPVVDSANFGFLQASVNVPEDAHMLDMVFADSTSSSGFYDNNRGLDYHVPVTGAAGTMRGLHVVHVTVEMAPIAKVGGMGDVVTALGRAIQDEGHTVDVVLPKYDIINYDDVGDLSWITDFNHGGTVVKVWRGMVEGLRVTFLEPQNGTFWVGCIYGRNDDASRFNFFCGAANEYIAHVSGWKADIVHCHDWPTAPVAYGNRGGAAAVFTIHNLNYGADLVARAMQASKVATTVSPTYAAEVAGHPSITSHLDKLYGVLNGIDTDIWDPAEDRFLPRSFGCDDVEEGKAAAKSELRRRAGLCEADVPLVGVVTRLTHQKGIHLIKHAAWRTLERGGQFVLLGSAPDGRVQNEFNALADDLSRQYPDRARLFFSYDEPLSHLIYAGSDMFLVPSMFEPCGLTQMIAMRYGTIPVVRRTGGLNDTVFDVDDDVQRAAAKGLSVNGFAFEGSDAGGLDYALNRALSCWFNDREFWAALSREVMLQDWSWTLPAYEYIELYYKARRG